ncbi:MAG: FAD-dependent oxidoreductase [Patescibacteria group bacterium]
MYDLIIIGGGPAGVAAGIYASRKKINTLLITKEFGGQWVISDKIENFIGFKSISGVELARALEEHLRSQTEPIEIKEGVFVATIKKTDVGFEVATSDGAAYQTKTILFALGSDHRKLNVPGEKEYEGKGVFYCSTCDAPLMKNKKVAVIGGGNSGLEAAIDLLPYASEIYILQRSNQLKGDAIYQEKLKTEPKVKILFQSLTKEIFGADFVSGIKYTDAETNEEKILNVEGIFVAIGYMPNTAIIKDLVRLDDNGHIIVDHKTLQTSMPGIWAAGDATDGLYNQFNTAMGDAINATLNIYDSFKSGI